jgi:hypothetical protein
VSDHVSVTVDPVDPTRFHCEFSAAIPGGQVDEVSLPLTRIVGAQILREQARERFGLWTHGRAGWDEVLQAIRWADEARNQLTEAERQEHDKWLFCERMWGMT